jgi:hypothetical protein
MNVVIKTFDLLVITISLVNFAIFAYFVLIPEQKLIMLQLLIVIITLLEFIVIAEFPFFNALLVYSLYDTVCFMLVCLAFPHEEKFDQVTRYLKYKVRSFLILTYSIMTAIYGYAMIISVTSVTRASSIVEMSQATGATVSSANGTDLS